MVPFASHPPVCITSCSFALSVPVPFLVPHTSFCCGPEGPFLYVHILRRVHARLACSVLPSKRTLPECTFVSSRQDFVFHLSGARAKRRQGFGSSQVERRLDIQTLCLQNQSPAGRDVLRGFIHLPPLISIAEHEYYKRDFKPGSSFLRATFLSLFQSKIVLILFCWKQQWVPYVGFLVPSPAVFQGSLCRIPYTKCSSISGFLM